MGLIPENFYNLGLPPSFKTCSRDVFKEGLILDVAQVLKIAGTVASVAAQLHSMGIMHSDLYAHNTLIDDDGNTLFGDFGAACFYNKADTKIAPALERIEVSAFGCFLDDLLSLCAERQTNPALIKVEQLRSLCMDASVSSRPNFNYLDTELLALKV